MNSYPTSVFLSCPFDVLTYPVELQAPGEQPYLGSNLGPTLETWLELGTPSFFLTVVTWNQSPYVSTMNSLPSPVPDHA
jgi:hypothetical protein